MRSRFLIWLGLFLMFWHFPNAVSDPIFTTSEAGRQADEFYCVGKMEYLSGVYKNRDAGVPEEIMVESLWKVYEESDDPLKRKRHFAWVDFERMIRDAYRKNGNGTYAHPDFARKRQTEYHECMRLMF